MSSAPLSRLTDARASVIAIKATAESPSAAVITAVE